jgi:hypothetical protein
MKHVLKTVVVEGSTVIKTNQKDIKYCYIDRLVFIAGSRIAWP